MGLLANLKLRRKLLIAMSPLAVMAILAGLYSSIQGKRIDAWYSQLIDNEVKAVHEIDTARSLNRRYDLYLYRLIGETDPDRRQVIDRSAAASRAAVQAIALRADRDRWFKAAVVRPATRP